MIIKIDLTFVPEHKRYSLVKAIDLELTSAISTQSIGVPPNSNFKHREKDRDYNDKKSLTVGTSITFYYNKPSLEEIKDSLQNILDKSNLDQFIVVEDTENENTLAIVKEGDIEQFGMYMCSHCGVLLKNEEERFVHERIHYFV